MAQNDIHRAACACMRASDGYLGGCASPLPRLCENCRSANAGPMRLVDPSADLMDGAGDTLGWVLLCSALLHSTLVLSAYIDPRHYMDMYDTKADLAILGQANCDWLDHMLSLGTIITVGCDRKTASLAHTVSHLTGCLQSKYRA